MDKERIDPSDAQHQEAFRRHLDRASEIVSAWPPWKRAVVGAEAEEGPPAEQPERNPECHDNDRNGNGKG
jgi:hypothetical protein